MSTKASAVREAPEFPPPQHHEDAVTWHEDVRVYRVTRKVNGKTFIVEFRAENNPGLGACSWSSIARELRGRARTTLDQMTAASLAA